MTVFDSINVGQNVVCVLEDNIEATYDGEVISKDNNFLKVIVDIDENSEEVVFKNAEWNGYVFEYENRSNEFRLFPSKSSHSKYLEKMKRVQISKYKLKKLINKYKIVKDLKEDRVFGIDFSELREDYYIYENCDEYFSRDLSKEDCLELSKFFNELSTKMN